jgi:hypothetical protein
METPAQRGFVERVLGAAMLDRGVFAAVSADRAATLQAEVVAKAFRGAEFLYTLRLESGTQVLSLVPSHHNHAIGERIGIRLAADHVVAFRNDSMAAA